MDRLANRGLVQQYRCLQEIDRILSRAEQQVSAKSNIIMRLQADLGRAKVKFDHVSEENSDLTAELWVATEEREKAEETAEEAQREIAALKGKISALESGIYDEKQAEETIEALQARIADLEAERGSNGDNDVSMESADVAQLRKDNERLIGTIATLKQKIKAKSKKIKQLKLALDNHMEQQYSDDPDEQDGTPSDSGEDAEDISQKSAGALLDESDDSDVESSYDPTKDEEMQEEEKEIEI